MRLLFLQVYTPLQAGVSINPDAGYAVEEYKLISDLIIRKTETFAGMVLQMVKNVVVGNDIVLTKK